MIEETLKFSGVQGVTSMVDVGCGIGGSSRYILTKYPGSCFVSKMHVILHVQPKPLTPPIPY
jgi:trans-aconitate methyltransferase